MARVAPSKTAEESLAEHTKAAEKRRAAAAQDPGPIDPRTQQLLDALASERRGYVQRGLDDRVTQVDEQIRILGG